MCESECYRILQKSTRIWKYKFVMYYPHNLHLSSIDEVNATEKPSAVAVCNSHENARSCYSIKEIFSKIFRKKLFTHHYFDRGI